MKLSLGAALLLVAGCAAAPRVPPPPPVTPEAPEGDGRAELDAAVAELVRHDEEGDWTTAICSDVALRFARVARHRDLYAKAYFDAGIAYQRCGDHGKATECFRLSAEQGYAPAIAKLSLYADKKDPMTIVRLEQAVFASEFRDVAALVDLGTLLMERNANAGSAGPGCQNDMECAKLHLHRALAIDDAYAPAANQLALYHLKVARQTGKRAPMELAFLVCAQTIKKSPRYAPIHNTAGIVLQELGQSSAASVEFLTATKIDPRLFEAHMNHAALNLSFRGWEPAEKSYKSALAIRPDDYDAHLGLALAIRGGIVYGVSDYDARVAASQAELDAAKKIAPGRPEAFYNEGILAQEFRLAGKAPKAEQLAALDRAETAFGQFIAKAQSNATFAPAVATARERLGDIATTRSFLP